MKKCKILIAATILMLSAEAVAQTSSTVKKKDLQPLIGNWNGTLTYLDYSSNKPYTMPANIKVKTMKKFNAFILSNVYPNEPKANSSDTLVISADGKTLDGATVMSKRN